MSSGVTRRAPNPIMQSAAWRISLWASLAFAIGTMLVFAMLHQFVSDDIQRRTDAWLSGEVEVLADVAERTPKDHLYSAVVGEVAELASKEVPNRPRSTEAEEQPSAAELNDSVFFLQTAENGSARLWVGSGDGAANLAAIRASKALPDVPYDVTVKGFSVPFRVATVRIADGSHVYLGLSERDELRVLRSLRVRFLALWFVIVLLGFVIVFYATRRMLGHVRDITEAASGIGQADLSSRVPTTSRNDEVGHLARTLNHMLDRIESAMNQLHTITDSLAHDLRSPLTAVRGKLEVVLSGDVRAEQIDPIVSAIDELDRLTEFLNTSLDVAEATADALRMSPMEIDIDELVRVMIDLYEPHLSEKGISVQLRSTGTVYVMADAALLHRVIANLLDNEAKHLPASCTVVIGLRSEDGFAELVVEDNGPGFDEAIGARIFEQRAKGRESKGHGLGLAFVAAVVRAHGGDVAVVNIPQGGARLTLTLPLASEKKVEALTGLALLKS